MSESDREGIAGAFKAYKALDKIQEGLDASSALRQLTPQELAEIEEQTNRCLQWLQENNVYFRYFEYLGYSEKACYADNFAAIDKAYGGLDSVPEIEEVAFIVLEEEPGYIFINQSPFPFNKARIRFVKWAIETGETAETTYLKWLKTTLEGQERALWVVSDEIEETGEGVLWAHSINSLIELFGAVENIPHIEEVAFIMITDERGYIRVNDSLTVSHDHSPHFVSMPLNMQFENVLASYLEWLKTTPEGQQRANWLQTRKPSWKKRFQNSLERSDGMVVYN
jgi:hypothetical protein